MPDTSTVFAPVSAAVAKVADLSRRLADDLTAPVQTLERAEHVVRSVQDLADQVHKISRVVSLLRTACSALDAVPGIDVVVGAVQFILSAASRIFSQFDRVMQAVGGTVMKEVSKGLAEIRAGARAIQTTLVKVAGGGHTFAVSLQIVGALHVLAAPLALQSDSPLAALARVLGAAETAVDFAVRPIQVLVTEALAVRVTLAEVADTLAALEGEVLSTVTSTVSSLFETLRPIHDGLENLLGAITPLRWLFDAAEWVTDHVVKPVIDTIFETLGINRLLKTLTQAFEDGLTAAMTLLDDFTRCVNLESLSDLKARLGEAAAQALTSHWASLSRILAAYQPQADGSFRDTLLRVMEAVLDQLKGRMPDWPVDPAMRG